MKKSSVMFLIAIITICIILNFNGYFFFLNLNSPTIEEPMEKPSLITPVNEKLIRLYKSQQDAAGIFNILIVCGLLIPNDTVEISFATMDKILVALVEWNKSFWVYREVMRRYNKFISQTVYKNERKEITFFTILKRFRSCYWF